jgi:hypothetical protein
MFTIYNSYKLETKGFFYDFFLIMTYICVIRIYNELAKNPFI